MANFSGRRIFITAGFSLLGLMGLWLTGCDLASKGNLQIAPTVRQPLAVKTMKLESTAFSANGLIPPKYTCDGQNISPRLTWDDPPVGTQSLALIVDDPDAPSGTFVHWVVYDIPVQSRQIPEAIPHQPTLIDAREVESGVQGKNDFSQIGYGGPCPPISTHRYFFKLYALDRQLGLKPGVTKDQAIAAMKNHILTTAELMGRYTRQR